MTIEEVEQKIREDVNNYPLLTEWIHDNEWGWENHELVMSCLCAVEKAEWGKATVVGKAQESTPLSWLDEIAGSGSYPLVEVDGLKLTLSRQIPVFPDSKARVTEITFTFNPLWYQCECAE